MGFSIGSLLSLGNKLPMRVEGFLPKPFRGASPVHATNKLKDLFVSSFSGGAPSRSPGRPNVGRFREGFSTRNRFDQGEG